MARSARVVVSEDSWATMLKVYVAKEGCVVADWEDMKCVNSDTRSVLARTMAPERRVHDEDAGQEDVDVPPADGAETPTPSNGAGPEAERDPYEEGGPIVIDKDEENRSDSQHATTESAPSGRLGGG